MDSNQGVRINGSLIVALLLGATCWLGLYGIWDNFAAQGLELIRSGDGADQLVGAGLIALHAFGLLFVLGCCAGVIALTIRSHRRDAADRHRYQG